MTILETLSESAGEVITTDWSRLIGPEKRILNVVTLLEHGFAPDDDYEESLEEYNEQTA